MLTTIHNETAYILSQHLERNDSPSILLIDDSTLDLRLLMSMMMDRQMRLTVAFDGKSGVDKASLQLPDLILLDVMMPKMDGFAVCRMLKSDERTRYIPIIFLSAATELDKRLEGLSLGAVDFICKPFSEQEVIAKVEIHLNLVRLAKEQAITAHQPEPITQGLAQKDAALIRAATQYLRQHLRHPPSTEVLANKLGTNEKRLNQAFHAGFAMPVFDWLREERLRQARELVMLTETSLLNISDHLGYSNPANFSKAFKERFGCSPRELRKQQQIDSLVGTQSDEQHQ